MTLAVILGLLFARQTIAAQVGLITQTLRIDADVHDLSPVGWLGVTGSGVVFASQPMDKQVRVFSPKGDPIARVGRKGQGPNEFSAMSSLGVIEDRAWVYDRSMDRVTWLSEAGTVVGASRLGVSASSITGFPTGVRVADAYLIAELPGGKHLIRSALSREGPLPAPFPRGMPIVRVSARGELEKIVAIEPYQEGLVSRGPATATSPFPVETIVAAAPDGSLLAVLPGSYADLSAGHVRLTLIGTAGRADTIFSRDLRLPMQPVSSRMRDSAISARLARIRSPELAKAYPSEALVPSAMPPVVGVVVGRDSSIWLRLRRAPGGIPYLVLDRTGREIGTVVFPVGSQVRAATRSQVWMTVENHDGVESIVMHSIAWRKPER